jgi:hypothetical protein
MSQATALTVSSSSDSYTILVSGTVVASGNVAVSMSPASAAVASWLQRC